MTSDSQRRRGGAPPAPSRALLVAGGITVVTLAAFGALVVFLDASPPGDGTPAPGSARAPRTIGSADEPDGDPLEISALDAIGYTAGTEEAPEAEGGAGVTVHRRELACPGVNLVLSAHAPEALLLDMDGRLLHRWSHEATQGWPDGREPPGADRRFWRRAALLDDGSLIAIYDGMGLVKLARDSTVEWMYAGYAHHDLEVAHDGRIFVLTRTGRMLPRIDAESPMLDDFITTLAPDGTELESLSVYDCFEGSAFDHFLDQPYPRLDPFHTNTLERLDGSAAAASPAFAEGNFLVSLRQTSVLAVIDPEARRVVWARQGDWRRQHQPSVLPSGNLLLFDNQGLDGRSRVIELSLPHLDVVWSYDGGGDGGFYSAVLGTTERLPNGNTLVVVSQHGRAVEVTADGEVAWEYVSPFRTGEHGERIANLFDVVRIDRSRTSAWLR